MKRIARPISNASRGVYFKRTFFSNAWAFDTASTNGFWRRFTPTFSMIPNHLEYASLFDEYKILGVKVTFHPRWTTVNTPVNLATGGTIGNNLFKLTTTTAKRDYGLIPTGTYNSTTYNQFLEELGTTARTRSMTRPVSIYFKPQIHDDQGGGVNMKPFPWIQMNILDVVCHGAQAFLHDYNFTALNNSGFGLDVQYTLYFMCRGAA